MLILVFFGALGGLARHIIHPSHQGDDCLPLYARGKYRSNETTEADQTRRTGGLFARFLTRLKYASPPMVIGAIAGLVVPLFLNASASSLLQGIIDGLPSGTTEAYKNIFFLIGYCVLAGIVGNHFLLSMAEKALQSAMKAEDTAEQAVRKAQYASEVAQRATQVETKMRNFQKGRTAIELEDFAEAERCFNIHVKEWPDDPRGYAWLAYTYKRTKSESPKKMISLIEHAISLKKKLPHDDYIGQYDGPLKWLINLACYHALDGRSSDEVTAMLRKAFEGAKLNNKQEIIKSLKNTLTSDPDLDSVNGGSAYNKLLAEVSEYLDGNKGS